MTEPLDLPDADPADLAASAALDAGSGAVGNGLDEATTLPDPRESPEPAMAERLEAFREVRVAMASGITPPDPATRDAHIAAALATLTGDGVIASTHGSDAAVSAAVPTNELAARRTGGAGHRTRNRWLAVAAAVALVALAVPLVNALRQQSSSSSNLAASTAATEPPDGAVTFGAPADPRAGDNGVTTTSAPTVASQAETAAPLTPGTTFTPAVAGDLGSASSPQELASLVQTAEPQAMTATPPPTGTADASTPTTTADPAGPAGCDGAIRAASPELGPLVVVTTAHYRGLPVEVLVYATTSSTGGAHRLIAVTPSDCGTVVDLTF